MAVDAATSLPIRARPARSVRLVETCDVVVVGAGPAGAAAAISLANAGREVIVVDKASFPRDKCCGDGLTTAALRELAALGVDPRVLPSFRQTDTAWLRSPSGRSVAFPMPSRGMYAAVAPRVELDAQLCAQAGKCGAEVRERWTVSGVASTLDHVRIRSDDGEEISARYVVAADGMWSPVRKALGLGEDGYLGEWHAFRQYASGVTGRARDELWVLFDEDLLPGYAWSFPLPDGRVNLGFGIQRGGRHQVRDMKRLWPDLLARPHVRELLGPDAELDDVHKAWPIPARIDRVVLADRRTLFVGDAACATDPMTGEGIGQALLTGRLAAEAIMDAGAERGEVACARYTAAVRDALVADHRMSVALSKLLESPVVTKGAIRVAGSTDWTRRNFARWLFEDEPRAIALTPRRWHPGFLARDGAYA
jgi:menaquinone-9 beta-reductase